MSRSWFVDDHRHLFEVQLLCELVELPRSTFYAWDTPTLSDTYLDDAWLASEIFDIHTASRDTYGAPRVRGQLRRHGHPVGRKRVARKLFLAGIKDLHDRTVVGWSMANDRPPTSSSTPSSWPSLAASPTAMSSTMRTAGPRSIRQGA